jgi:glycerol-3-phosphate dehydrogenase (NAD(P)+)
VRVAVVGAGAWGTALASHAARLDHDVAMWANEEDVAADVNERHQNVTFLPGIQLPTALRASTDMSAVVSEAELVVLVPPSEHLRRVSFRVAPVLRKDAVIVVATKGIEETTHALMTQVVAQAMPSRDQHSLAVLSGPSFAREVAGGLPTDVVVASRWPAHVQTAQEALHSPVFRG